MNTPVSVPCLESANLAFRPDRLTVPADYVDLFAAQTGVLDCHAEESVFVVLIVGGKCVLFQVNDCSKHESCPHCPPLLDPVAGIGIATMSKFKT
jgi:hypothetical protein